MLSLVLDENDVVLDDAILTNQSNILHGLKCETMRYRCQVIQNRLKEWNSSERGKYGPVET